MAGPLMVVISTVPDRPTARRVAEGLLDRRLAACVTVVPGAESYYEWEGKREISEEFLLLIKTTVECYPALEQSLRQMHPYDCPEIVGWESTGAWEGYADWVRRSVGKLD